MSHESVLRAGQLFHDELFDLRCLDLDLDLSMSETSSVFCDNVTGIVILVININDN